MFRFIRFLTIKLQLVIREMVQLLQGLHRIGYVSLLMISSFLVQLHICLYFADTFDLFEVASESGFYPLYDWSKHAERFLVCCGAFLWIAYILPNRNGVSPWAQGIWALRPPLWVAFFHAGCWVVIWGPLANTYKIYEGMSSLGILACLTILTQVYYVQVWQDIAGQIRQTQKIKAESRRFV
jgi:hypothetical protein